MQVLAQPPTLHPQTAAVAQTSWVEVVSHLDPSYGGLSAAVPELGRSLANGLGAAPIGISIAAFCAPEQHFQPDGFSPDQVRYWPAGRNAWMRDRLDGATLRRSFTDSLQEADGVHIHGIWEAGTSIAAVAARSLGKPYVLSAHGMLEPWALAQKRVKKLVYRFLVERSNVAGAACLHALTRREAEQFKRFGARSPIAIVPNAVECPADATGELFLDRYPVLNGKRIVLFLARLHPKKGLDLLLSAWASMSARFPGAHLVIAGPDSEGTEARLRGVVATSHLEDSVLFTGMLRGAMKWSALAAAEAFILPSSSEGLSVGVLEAMGMGLPVLITHACNMPEVASHCAGWVVEPTLEQVRGALEKLLRNTPETSRSIGRCGAMLVQSRYSWPVVAQQMAEVYDWVLGGRKPESVDLVKPS